MPDQELLRAGARVEELLECRAHLQLDAGHRHARGMPAAKDEHDERPDEDESSEERTDALLAAPPASLLFRPGHVMFTLGSVDGKTYVIHSLSGCWEKTQEGLKRRRIRRVLVSDAYFLTSTEGRNLDDCTGVGIFR